MVRLNILLFNKCHLYLQTVKKSRLRFIIVLNSSERVFFSLPVLEILVQNQVILLIFEVLSAALRRFITLSK